SYTPKHLAEKILTSRNAIEGERQVVTVLFCDMANSTTLADRLGPDAMHALINRLFEVALAEVHRYEGTINQFLGDGFMALFGAPLAFEDHARRAVLAALDIQRAVRSLPGEGVAGAADLAVRMGLNTGPVVVGKIGDNLRMDYTAVGDTTNLAARLEHLAKPGDIYLSEPTYDLVRSAAECRPLGSRAIKGKADPSRASRWAGVSATGSRSRSPSACLPSSVPSSTWRPPGSAYRRSHLREGVSGAADRSPQRLSRCLCRRHRLFSRPPEPAWHGGTFRGPPSEELVVSSPTTLQFAMRRAPCGTPRSCSRSPCTPSFSSACPRWRKRRPKSP